jgi:hypothetical protein
MTQRHYEAATVFNCRIVDMRHLWNPSLEYKGKKQDKPSYFASFIVQKTQAQWHLEPALASLTAACGKFYTINPNIVEWPVTDGDMPNPETGKQSEWAKGHWIFSASTYDNPPGVELVQAGGQLVKLPNKAGVKSGDFVMAGVTGAISQNNVRKMKLYLNAVVFTAPGEEIVFANSVSGAELMKSAEQQGFRPTGFSGSPGFGGGAAFGGQGAAGFMPPQGQQNGFPGSQMQQPGHPGGFAPNGGPGFASGAAPGPFGAPGAGPGSATSPFNAPGAPFAAPKGPFG